MAQLHSVTGDNMKDREATVGQRKVSENRLSLFPGRCGRVKEQCHTSKGQTVQDTKECGQESASELISFTTPEANGRCHRGSQKHQGEAVLSAAFTRRSDSCAGPETASEIQRLRKRARNTQPEMDKVKSFPRAAYCSVTNGFNHCRWSTQNVMVYRAYGSISDFQQVQFP